MDTPRKLALFAAGIAAVGVASYGVGDIVGPIGETTPSHHATQDAVPSAGDALPGGLVVSASGYTLALDSSLLPAGRTTLSFHVTGPDGAVVTDYTATHGQDLHLIAVQRDGSGFQHVHPTMAANGTWSEPLSLTPGAWRVFAEFRAGSLDEAITLGADAFVAGDFTPRPLPSPSTSTTVGGYTVTVTGRLRAGTSSDLGFTVTRDGRPVTDLQPYLAAYGHLVALRAGDLAYLHVHPTAPPDDGSKATGPTIGFGITAPSEGTYHLYLGFRHGDVVHTAELTLVASTDASTDDGHAGTANHTH